MPIWLSRLLPIAILLAVITIVVARLPKVELGHSKAFTTRRFLNWFPLGLTYAFLYMARYNLAAAKNALDELGLMSNQAFGTIKGAGSAVYGVSFLVNGPLTDRLGGRRTIMFAAVGALVANVAMGLFIASHPAKEQIVPVMGVLYGVNMYFQSFGAVSIVKVNASWFHLRERGTFGGIFGILISLGLYFAYDWSRLILEAKAPIEWVFYVPAAILGGLAVVDFLVVRDTPGLAGHADFDVGDASSGETGPALGVLAVAGRMFRNRAIVIIAMIEFCSGYLRAALMDWYYIFSKATGAIKVEFVPKHWGLMQCVAGILGGMMAGVISDRVFGSRRGPVSAILYGVMFTGTLFTASLLTSPLLGWVVTLMMLAIIGVHGMLSGTASMDFGGRKNAGVAVGIIDGFVYLGVATQAWILGALLPKPGPEQKNPDLWTPWPHAMIPLALVGLLLTTRLWNARAQPKTAAAH